jgi:ATP-binding cassette subfamily C (CFTR/MRP) protein 4
MFRVLQPIFMGMLVRYYSNTLDEYTWIPDPMDEKWAWIFGSAIVLCSILYCFTHHALFFGVQRTGMRVRVACCSLIYRKVRKTTSLYRLQR